MSREDGELMTDADGGEEYDQNQQQQEETQEENPPQSLPPPDFGRQQSELPPAYYRVCKYMNTRTGCRQGDACSFSHICPFYNTNIGCKVEHCVYRHELSDKTPIPKQCETPDCINLTLGRQCRDCYRRGSPPTDQRKYEQQQPLSDRKFASYRRGQRNAEKGPRDQDRGGGGGQGRGGRGEGEDRGGGGGRREKRARDQDPSRRNAEEHDLRPTRNKKCCDHHCNGGESRDRDRQRR